MGWESDDREEIDEVDDDHYRSHGQMNLSRLSVCTSNTSVFDAAEEDDDLGMNMTMMSALSLESFDADVEDESNMSDVVGKRGKGKAGLPLVSSDESDGEESSGCYSLPATPPRRRTKQRAHQVIDYHHPHAAAKECVSETEAADPPLTHRRRRRRRRRSIMRERLLGDSVFWRKFQDDYDDETMHSNNSKYTRNSSCSCSGGENQMDHHHHHHHHHHHQVATLITRPKGGKRSLLLDLEEVKACSDLGFDLDLPFPPPISTTTRSATSSASNSPVHAASWRISSPGDDPRDVKARLKVWAQAVALASASSSRNPIA